MVSRRFLNKLIIILSLTVSVGTLTFFVDLKSRSVDGEFTAENIMDIMSTSKIFNDTAID